MSHIEPRALPMTVHLPADLHAKVARFAERRGLDLDTLVRVALTSAVRPGVYHELGSKIAFGKYKGEILETVIRVDPDYIGWCMINMEDRFQMSPEAHGLLAEMQKTTVPAS